MCMNYQYSTTFFCLLKKFRAAIKVSNYNIGFDLIFNQKLHGIICSYLDKFLIFLNVFYHFLIFQTWTSSYHNDILALDPAQENLWVKCLLLYHFRQNSCSFLILFSAVSKICTDPLIVGEPVCEFHLLCKRACVGVTINIIF